LAALAAVTDTAAVLLTFGAVNNPLEEIVPALALHTIEVAAVLVKLAANCSVAPDETTPLAGETVGRALFESGALAAGCDADRDPQPDVTRMRTSKPKSTA
jgi:hypothetical protein